MNPFSDEYVQRELDFLGVKDGDYGKVSIDTINITGRCDDYLNMNFRTGSPDMPRMKIDGQVWMSMTYMEIQSMYVPLRRAEGHVGTAGLGLGYFALAAAANEDVTQVTAYESHPDVIAFFKEAYKDREEIEKIHIVEGDARETVKGRTFDFFFSDIYQTLMPDESVDDIHLFTSENEIGEYRFWCQEKVLFGAILEMELIDASALKIQERQFLRFFMEDDERYDLYSSVAAYNEEYVEAVLEALGYDFY